MKIFVLLTALLFNFQTFAAQKERQKVSEPVKKELLAVFSANEKLHNTFFDYEKKKEELSTFAKSLSQKIDKISNPEIKKLLENSQKKLNEISPDSKKDENDQRYHIVSTALIQVLNSYDIGEGYNAYSCPMVQKKWVQNSKKMAQVHNPYAPGMPQCGSKDSNY